MSNFQVTVKPKPNEAKAEVVNQEEALKDDVKEARLDEAVGKGTTTTTLEVSDNEYGDVDDTATATQRPPASDKEAREMNRWSTDKIVAIGLVVMGVISISGYIAYALYTGNSNGTEIPMAIVSGLTGFLGRGALVHDEYDYHHNRRIAVSTSQDVEKGGKGNGRDGTSQRG